MLFRSCERLRALRERLGKFRGFGRLACEQLRLYPNGINLHDLRLRTRDFA